VNGDSYQRKRHLGVDYAIWERDNSWFWFLIHPISQGGMIGASADEAQAMHEARWSIEESLQNCWCTPHEKARTSTTVG
jgi:hypothetical protein